MAAIDATEDDKRVDLEVREVEIRVYGVQTDEEIDKRLLLSSRDVLQ